MTSSPHPRPRDVLPSDPAELLRLFAWELWRDVVLWRGWADNADWVGGQIASAATESARASALRECADMLERRIRTFVPKKRRKRSP